MFNSLPQDCFLRALTDGGCRMQRTGMDEWRLAWLDKGLHLVEGWPSTWIIWAKRPVISSFWTYTRNDCCIGLASVNSRNWFPWWVFRRVRSKTSPLPSSSSGPEPQMARFPEPHEPPGRLFRTNSAIFCFFSCCLQILVFKSGPQVTKERCTNSGGCP